MRRLPADDVVQNFGSEALGMVVRLRPALRARVLQAGAAAALRAAEARHGGDAEVLEPVREAMRSIGLAAGPGKIAAGGQQGGGKTCGPAAQM